jgi:ribosomal protein S18 acetylase RimI-like enzyme
MSAAKNPGATGARVVVERMTEPDWERVRRTRLRALRDSPDAFGRTLAEEERQTPDDWRARLRSPVVATWIATLPGASDGSAPPRAEEGPRTDDVGIVVAAPWNGSAADLGLFAMWVAPAARGCGVGDALVRTVQAEARARGARRVLLDVADGNVPAIRLYERHGFQATGNRGTLPPPREHVPEHERAWETGSGKP